MSRYCSSIAFSGAAAQQRRHGRLRWMRGSAGARDNLLNWPCWLLAVLLCAAGHATAAELGPIQGFDIRLDTTVRTSLGLRLEGQNLSLLANANADDGDRAFKPGVMSERVDVTSQLDVSRGDFGFTLSADGWYDAAYQTHDANHSAATFNPVSVPANEFPANVRRLMGATVELSNAYVRHRFEIAGTSVTVRVGRQTLLWGESLFFPQDGIAAAQAPVDVIKAISQPLIRANELFLPVSQADIRVSLPYGLSLEAYDQFEWRPDRTPGVASYFSTNDVAGIGGERAFTPGGGSVLRAKDSTPTGIGQFGVALRRTSDTVDLGLYAIRYNAKEPQIAAIPPATTTYREVFPRGIDLLGISASTYLGSDTLAGELSERWHMPLVSRALASVPAGSAGGSLGYFGTSVATEPILAGYAVGQTLQALASFERQLRPGRLWNAAVLDAEVAATDLLRVESNPRGRFPGTTKLATALELVFAPTWFQVLPGLDITAPVGVQVGLSGRSSVDPGMVAGTGNVTLSVAATYRAVWEGSISYTHFIGGPHYQALADRDFVIFSLSRTF